MAGEALEPKAEDYSAIDAKIEKGGQEMGKGFSDVVCGTTTMLAKAVGAGGSLVRSGFNKIGEKCCKDTEKKEEKAAKAKLHFEKAKKKGKKAGKSAKTAVLGGIDTLQGTSRVTYNSVKKSIKSMRSEDAAEHMAA